MHYVEALGSRVNMIEAERQQSEARVKEEVEKRVKAEEEAKREKEMVDKLFKILLEKNSVVTETRREETEVRSFTCPGCLRVWVMT